MRAIVKNYLFDERDPKMSQVKKRSLLKNTETPSRQSGGHLSRMLRTIKSSVQFVVSFRQLGAEISCIKGGPEIQTGRTSLATLAATSHREENASHNYQHV